MISCKCTAFDSKHKHAIHDLFLKTDVIKAVASTREVKANARTVQIKSTVIQYFLSVGQIKCDLKIDVTN